MSRVYTLELRRATIAEISPLTHEAVVSREDVRRVLDRWEDGELTRYQVWQWAEAVRLSLFDEFELDDEEGAEEDSLTREIVAHLDFLDQDPFFEEDIPAFRACLLTPVGQYKVGLTNLARYIDGIDWNSRQDKVRSIGGLPYDPPDRGGPPDAERPRNKRFERF